MKPHNSDVNVSDYLAKLKFSTGRDAVHSNFLIARRLMEECIWTRNEIYTIETPLHLDGATVVCFKLRQPLEHIAIQKMQATLPFFDAQRVMACLSKGEDNTNLLTDNSFFEENHFLECHAEGFLTHAVINFPLHGKTQTLLYYQTGEVSQGMQVMVVWSVEPQEVPKYSMLYKDSPHRFFRIGYLTQEVCPGHKP